MTIVDANDATRTTFCKIDSCTDEAKWVAGPFRGLCEVHAQPIRDRMSASQRQPKPKTAAAPSPGFASRAKRLVKVGAKLDRAVTTYRKQQERIEPAKQALDAAMREWRAACRELGGEGADV